MANLNPLIRLRRHTVEEKQKLLSQLYKEADLVIAKRQQLIDQMEHEKEIANAQNTPDASADYGRYAENVRKKIAMFTEAVKKVEIRIQAAQEDVRQAFAEMKKVQIVQRARQADEKREQEDKEAQELDEIALEGFRRKDTE